MIQFNLLPDVKLEFIKAQRARRLVITVSTLVSLVAIVLLVALLMFGVFQRKHLSDLQHDINAETATLQNKPNIKTILTVQNQLESLTTLHNSKPAASRLFGYLNELTPASVSINNFNVDYTQNSMTITGTADALSSVNQFVDTLKLTTYEASTSSTTSSSDSSGSSSSPAFSNVVLSAFGENTGAQNPNQAVTYTIGLSFDPNIFNIAQTVALQVPSVTTRAQLQSPTDLFEAAPPPSPSTGSGATSSGGH